MGNLKHGSMVFNSHSQSLESGLYSFHETLCSFLLPSSVTVVVEWWGCSVMMCLFTSCPLPKDCWWRVTGEDFLSYHITKTFFSVHAGVCFKANVGSAVLFPIPPLWKLPSAKCTVCASKCIPSSPPATCGVFRASTTCYKPTLRRNIHYTAEQQQETHVPDAATEPEQANTWSQKP